MQTTANLAKALVAAHADLRNPGFDKVNTAFGKPSKYASLSAHIDASRAVLAKHGLAVAQLVGGGEGRLRLSTLVIHTSGETLESTVEVAMPADPQKVLALLTYLRRGCLAAALNVAGDEDDDGNAVGGTTAAASAPAKPVELTDAELSARMEAARAKHGVESALSGKRTKRETVPVEGIVAKVEERDGARGPYWWIHLEDGKRLTAWDAANSMAIPGRAYRFDCAVSPAKDPKYGPNYSVQGFAETGEEIPF